SNSLRNTTTADVAGCPADASPGLIDRSGSSGAYAMCFRDNAGRCAGAVPLLALNGTTVCTIAASGAERSTDTKDWLASGEDKRTIAGGGRSPQEGQLSV